MLIKIFVEKWLKNLENDSMPYDVASDLGLQFLPIPL